MSEITTTGTYRMKLLNNTLEKNLSASLQRKIGQHITSLDPSKKEKRAKEINDLLMNCKTQVEVEQIVNNL